MPPESVHASGSQADLVASGQQLAASGRNRQQPANVRPHGGGICVDATVTMPPWVEGYLEHLSLEGSKTDAARAVKVPRSTVMRLRQRSTDFTVREESALRAALALIEAEIKRRAVHGVRRVRYGRDGKVLTKEVEYSDVLILRLAERLETGTWRQKQQVEHSGQVGFKTRAERLAALEAAEAAMKQN